MIGTLGYVLISLLLAVGTAHFPFINTPTVFAPTQSASRSSAPNVIPFELVNRHIILPVKVNDSRPLSFVLDTGDEVAIVNLGTARQLGLKLRGQVRVGGAGAQLQMGAFVGEATFIVAGLEGFSQPVRLALPLDQMAPRLGQDFDGIIGSEFISQFVVEIDYKAKVLRLHNKNDFVYSGPGEAIPIKLVHGHPIVEAEVTPIGGTPLQGSFVLDIGAGLALALYNPFVTQHGLLNDTKTIRLLGGAGAGGETVGRLGRVSQLKIGKFVVREPVTLFSQDKQGAFASRELSGNIGARIARKFRVFLDYSRNRIILEPSSSFAEPFNESSAGLNVIAEGNDYRTFRIVGVLENSPASEAGLLVNDIIVAVNNQSARELSLSNINELFEQPLARKLRIRRGDSTLEITITPRRLI